MSDCEHEFVYAGLRWATGARQLPGGSAHNVYYGHSYFCKRCLELRVKPVDLVHNDYQTMLNNSTPATIEERNQLIPNWDR